MVSRRIARGDLGWSCRCAWPLSLSGNGGPVLPVALLIIELTRGCDALALCGKKLADAASKAARPAPSPPAPRPEACSRNAAPSSLSCLPWP